MSPNTPNQPNVPNQQNADKLTGTSNRPGGAKPPADLTNGNHRTNIFDPLYLEFLHELLNSGELETEFKNFKALKNRDDPTAKPEFIPDKARTALGSVIKTILEEPLNELLQPYEEQSEKMVQTSAGIKQLLTRIQQQVNSLTAMSAKFDEINRALSAIDRQVNSLPASDAMLKETKNMVTAVYNHWFQFHQGRYEGSPSYRRFQTEYFKEKRAIANYVVEQYFNKRIHCFFQASTTAFHLADALTFQGAGDGCVVHTNSFALPDMLLRIPDPSPVSVYPVSGQYRDTMCAGWLYAHDDHTADSYMRSLFDHNRGHSTVTTAFITPQYMDVHGNCYFARLETLSLVRAILDRARNIVVLTPSARIYKSADAIAARNNDLVYEHVKLDLALQRKDREPSPVPLDSFRCVAAGEYSQLQTAEEGIFRTTCERLGSKLVPVVVAG